VAARNNGPILRYRSEGLNGFLRRYYANGLPATDLDVASQRTGTGDAQIPKYLLIYGGPAEIPWRAQYALNMSRCVGRIDLEGDALERYISYLVGDWAGAECNPLAPVIWSVNFGGSDITSLMQQVLADALAKRFAGDADFGGAVHLRDKDATGAALAEAISKHPGLVVTTSHGMTGPAAQPGSLADQLGLLVDTDHALVSADILPAAAVPGGAIWYSHACCSAGSDAASQCADLFPPGHPIGDTLREVSRNAGNATAPLVKHLFSAPTPVRAFIGHVEPTFDWTLRDPFTAGTLGDSFVSALYDRLYVKRTPLALAFEAVFREAGTFLTNWAQAIADVNKDKPSAAGLATYWQVAALDRQSIVIFGDPAVTLPL
jgi:hypothetical protein